MSNEIDFKFVRPFGPMICKVTMPKNIIKKLNEYVDKVIIDKNSGSGVVPYLPLPELGKKKVTN